MLFTQNLSGVCFQQITLPPPSQKLIMVFSYRRFAVHMFSCYLHIKMPGEGGILPCYLHRRYRSIFSKKIPTIKVTMVFLPQLSDMRCVYYHLFTHKLSGIFSHLSSPMVKVTMMFVS